MHHTILMPLTHGIYQIYFWKNQWQVFVKNSIFQKYLNSNTNTFNIWNSTRYQYFNCIATYQILLTCKVFKLMYSYILLLSKRVIMFFSKHHQCKFLSEFCGPVSQGSNMYTQVVISRSRGNGERMPVTMRKLEQLSWNDLTERK